MPSVSIAIPVFNEADYIGEAVDSALTQTHPADEVLVFDNASTDGSEQIAAERLPPGAVRRAVTNVGATENFNRAVRDATGEYFAWLGGDDLLRPDYVKRTFAVLEAEPEVDACFCFVDYFDQDGELPWGDRPIALNDPSPRRRIRSYLRRVRWCEVYSLYRRDALLASPMFTAEFGTDVLLSWWFVLRGRIRVVDEVLLLKRIDARDRSDASVVESLNPGARPPRRGRPRWGLWRALWRGAAREGVPSQATRIARQEMLLALLGRDWLQMLAADVVSMRQQAKLKRGLERLGVRVTR